MGAVLDVSHDTNGYALRLRFETTLDGPCMRCLEPAERTLQIDVREVDQPGAEADELDSPYVSSEELDIAAWANDAFAFALPAQVVCREDCPGLCPVCGENLNTTPHEHEKPVDGRWAKLSELKLK